MTRTRPPYPQLDLFAPTSAPTDDTRIVLPRREPAPALGPAAVDTTLGAIGQRLPAPVRLGTSSWSFPGWAGIVYDRVGSPQELARVGLEPYARHPLLRAVGIDRTYYAPISREQFAAYAHVVPDAFRFLVKAHEQCTLTTFPRLPRYGEMQGLRNPFFLDSAYATDMVVGPVIEGLGAKAGPLLFQFPPQSYATFGGTAGFAERLYTFLQALPRGPLYAVEIRNASLLSSVYADALVAAGACHCASVHPTMPDVRTQIARTARAAAPATVMRWMLGAGQGYEDARDRYQPFDRLVDPDVQTRDAIAGECVTAIRASRPAYIIINNKAEGSAPLSVFRLAEAIVSLL